MCFVLFFFLFAEIKYKKFIVSSANYANSICNQNMFRDHKFNYLVPSNHIPYLFLDEIPILDDEIPQAKRILKEGHSSVDLYTNNVLILFFLVSTDKYCNTAHTSKIVYRFF